MQDTSLESSAGAPNSPERDAHADFPLGLGDFNYRDLYQPARLGQLTAAFYDELRRADATLHADLLAYTRARGANLKGTRAESELLIACAPHLSRFVARLFDVETERAAHMERITAQDAIFKFKNFITRRALKRVPPEQALTVNADKIHDALESFRRAAFPDTLAADAELDIARMTVRLLDWEEQLSAKPGATGEHVGDVGGASRREIGEARARVAKADGEVLSLKEFEIDAGGTEALDEDAAFVKASLRLLETWASVHATQGVAKSRVSGWVSFRVPHPLNYEHLVQLERHDAE